jgi:hypothetical protein
MRKIEKHPNLISVIEYGQNVERYRIFGEDKNFVEYLALEFAENKTLLDYLISKPDIISE